MSFNLSAWRGIRALVITLAVLCFAAASGGQPAHAEAKVKASVLKFGTVSWLLDVIKHHNFDKKEGFTLDVSEAASGSATQVSLLGGDTDTIVTDWFWVLQQRSFGTKFVFVPYSAALGSIMVPANSPIKSIADLKDKRLGVAGSPIDKSWLLVRAYGEKTGAGDLAQTAEPLFAAPPLLNEQLISGQVDAIINNWNLAAKLEAAGYRRLVSIAELMKEFDIPAPLPLVGFVFSEEFAAKKTKEMQGFVNSMQNAQRLLLTSDAEWDRIRPRMQVANDAEFKVMRDRYREGLLHTWGERDRVAAAKLFDLMVKTGGEDVTGKGVKFDPSIFWGGLAF